MELLTAHRRSSIISNSLSGATQLLLLAHTPVSRKVFQFFHCNELGHKKLLRADYNIDCRSAEYYSFMSLVIAVMVGFTIGLPAVISFYLFRHRKNLYSTKTNQRIGWLYDPFVRGAEFWQVHDLLMKMILTGMLIYVPPTSRAGIAILVCVVACCNLNYFQPHKNKVLFWLSEISFITTLSKYTVALLLSSSYNDQNEIQIIGTLLIVLDFGFMISSVLAILISLCMLRARVKVINKKAKEERNSIKITPVVRTAEQNNKSQALKNWE